MSDENVVDQPVEATEPAQDVPTSTAAPEDVVVQGTPVNTENKPDPALDPATSALPYHTEATEKIAADRAEEIANTEPGPYKYEVNGYTVTEVEGPNPQATAVEDANRLWKATLGDFEQFFSNKRAAEMFAETHSPQFAANATVKDAPAVQDIPKT